MRERKSLIQRVLDASVVFDFDRTGFERHKRSFKDPAIGVDLAGKTIAITGASSGLGFATAKALHHRGAHVILLCRNLEKAEGVIQGLPNQHRLQIERVDVSSFESIDLLSKRLEGVEIDVLIHNAGVLLGAYQQSADGLEKTLATNLVGPFRLTERLGPSLREGARIIFVSSGGMYTQKLDLDTLEHGPTPFDGAVAYAQTKRAQVMISDRLAAHMGERATVVSMHPGWADTPGVSGSMPRFHRMTRAILRSADEGADTIVWLAATEEPLRSGGFYFDRGLAPRHKMSRTRTPELIEPLWKSVRKWSGVAEDV